LAVVLEVAVKDAAVVAVLEAAAEEAAVVVQR